ncbi:unnamed protein product [Brassica oleracea var. botrytis]
MPQQNQVTLSPQLMEAKHERQGRLKLFLGPVAKIFLSP